MAQAPNPPPAPNPYADPYDAKIGPRRSMSLRERLASFLLGNSESFGRQQFVEGLTGSDGLGQSGMGLADFVPGGQVLAFDEAMRAGDPQGAALSIMPLPGASKGAALSKGIRAYHGSRYDFDKFDPRKARTARHIYAAPNEADAKAYGDRLYELNIKGRVGDFRPEYRGAPEMQALREAYDEGLSDWFESFDEFLEAFDNGDMYQRLGSQQAQNATMDELFGRGYEVLRVPDAGFSGRLSESLVVENPELIEILRKYGLAGKGAALSKGIRAYHGSPHDFDRFDISKIGSGEGVQAYGHGLYFAENEEVARNYREALSARSKGEYGRQALASAAVREAGVGLPERVLGSLEHTHLDKEDPLKLARDLYRSTHHFDFGPHPPFSDSPEGQAIIQRMADAISAGRNAARNAGRMYEVEIAADPNSFLDWDRGLKDQPENVREAYRSLRGWTPEKMASFDPGRSGMSLYNDIALTRGRNAPMGQEQVAATQALKEAGVPGIKYLDQGSRGSGDGTRNYVVFNDELVKILRKYGLAGLAALPPSMLGAALMADQPSENGL